MKKILEINHLSKQFNLEAGFFSKNKQNVFAVNDVSFSIDCGSTYGIVGESGCGKTTTARMIIQMYKQTSGEIFFYDADNGLDKNVSDYSKKELRLYREKVKYIFQDPARSLNPRMNIYDVLTAGLRYSSYGKEKKNLLNCVKKLYRK